MLKTFPKIFGIDFFVVRFFVLILIIRKKRIQPISITLNSTPTGLFIAADLTVITCIVTVNVSFLCLSSDIMVCLQGSLSNVICHPS